MPPRKKPPTPVTAKAKGKAKAPAKPRRSALAAEHGIAAEDEREIKEAWQLFALEGIPGYNDEANGVIRTHDLRKCMAAIGIAPNPQELGEYIEILDPEKEGYITYAAFVGVCALRITERGEQETDEEVQKAFRMFTRGGDGPINIGHLRRVAGELREDVGDEVLRAMILEANGGRGVNRGVGVEEFRGVMVRAGVFQ